MKEAVQYHAIRVNAEKCFGCTHCIKICPTEAIRIRNGVAEISNQRCVDCGNCLRACPADAFYVEQDDFSRIKKYKYRVALFPSVFIGQFAEKHTENQIYQALTELGFTHVFEVEQSICLLAKSVQECFDVNSERPLISSFCPAIVRLVQRKYPSLAANIVNREAPHNLAAHFATGQLIKKGADPDEIGIFYISPCSAKMAAVKQPVIGEPSAVNGTFNMKDLFNRVMKVISETVEHNQSESGKYLSSEGILWSLPRGEITGLQKRAMAIDGIHNVVKFLERLENDEVPELDFLELKSCRQGCAGGILLTGNRFLTVERLQKRAQQCPTIKDLEVDAGIKQVVGQKLVTSKVEPQFVFALDSDRAKALAKMKKAEKILCQLPGIDCGGCGAPNCHALAEDMVQGLAKMSDCIFLQYKYLKEQKTTTDKAYKNLEKTWGTQRFDADCTKKGSRNEGF